MYSVHQRLLALCCSYCCVSGKTLALEQPFVWSCLLPITKSSEGTELEFSIAVSPMPYSLSYTVLTSCYMYVGFARRCLIYLHTYHELWTFRHFASSPPGRFAPWTFCPLDDSPPGQFAPWTFCPLDDSPPGRFATWTFRPLEDSPLGRFATWTVRPHTVDDSPPTILIYVMKLMRRK